MLIGSLGRLLPELVSEWEISVVIHRIYRRANLLIQV
jgi:hypothetical protein